MALHSVKKTLVSKIEGLYYPSESDFPFEIIDWGRKDEGQISTAVIAASEFSQPVETMGCQNFFDAIARQLRAAGDAPSKLAAAKYTELQSFISGITSFCKVWRCGKVRVSIYVVIRLKDGHVLALKTMSIET